jgi:hypothetical protein
VPIRKNLCFTPPRKQANTFIIKWSRIGYGFQKGFPTSDWQWRWPLIIQLMPAFVVITCGLHVIPESTRWLIRKSRYKRALQIMSKLRDLPMNHPDIIQEFNEIHYSVQLDRMKRSSKTQEILFNPNIRRQLVLGCLLQFFQQLACTNAIVSHLTLISLQYADHH